MEFQCPLSLIQSSNLHESDYLPILGRYRKLGVLRCPCHSNTWHPYDFCFYSYLSGRGRNGRRPY